MNIFKFIYFVCYLAVLLYLNYKNAYSYWNEQRMSLNEDVCMKETIESTCLSNE